MFYNTLYEPVNIYVIKTLIMRDLKTDYTAIFLNKATELIEKRKYMRITQTQIAYKLKVSLRTIQNFEAYNCMDYFIVYAYNQILNNQQEL